MNDLTGQRFGRLTVQARATSTRAGAAQWSCTCDCGNATIARGTNLQSGHTTSCGCLRACRARLRAARQESEPMPLAYPVRYRLDLYRGAFAGYEFGFAAVWPEDEPAMQPVLTVPAMPRPKQTGPVCVTLARALFELQRQNLITPQGARSTARWMLEEGIAPHTVMVSTSDEEVRAAYAKLATSAPRAPA